MKLNILNKFLLLAHHPEKGRFLISETHINYGIIGAALLEMSLDGQIKIDDDKLIVLENVKSNRPIISEILTEVKNSKKSREIRYWLNRLARNSRQFKWIILTELQNEKLVRIEKRKLLGLIPYRKSYLVDRTLRESVISQLKNDVLFRKNSLNEDSMIMLGLIEACRMHQIITSDKVELKKLKKELKEIIKDSTIASTVDETLKQIQAAIMVSIIAASSSTALAGSN